MRQIPAWLLNDTATYAAPTGEDAYGNPTNGTPVTLTAIYVEVTQTREVGTLGEQDRDDLVVFFDAENSKPLGQTFANGGKVVWNGATYLTRNVKPYKNPLTNAMHHWEVGLVG